MINKDNIDFAFAIRYYNHQNYLKAKNFLSRFGVKIYKIKNTSADGFLYESINLNHDFIVTVDEDFYLYDKSTFLELLNYVNYKNYAISGMRDGGACRPRNFHPLVLNTYFLILNIKIIRNIINKKQLVLTAKDIKEKTILHLKEHADLDKNYMDIESNYEPYYPFFFELIMNDAKFLYLDCENWDNDPGVMWEGELYKVATILKFNNLNFGIHCWFSSGYYDFGNRGNRMDIIYKFAISKMDKSHLDYFNYFKSKSILIDVKKNN